MRGCEGIAWPDDVADERQIFNGLQMAYDGALAYADALSVQLDVTNPRFPSRITTPRVMPKQDMPFFVVRRSIVFPEGTDYHGDSIEVGWRHYMSTYDAYVKGVRGPYGIAIMEAFVPQDTQPKVADWVAMGDSGYTGAPAYALRMCGIAYPPPLH